MNFVRTCPRIHLNGCVNASIRSSECRTSWKIICANSSYRIYRDVLMRHLDEEVSDLAGENLKKYFTLEELDKIPM